MHRCAAGREKKTKNKSCPHVMCGSLKRLSELLRACIPASIILSDVESSPCVIWACSSTSWLIPPPPSVRCLPHVGDALRFLSFLNAHKLPSTIEGGGEVGVVGRVEGVAWVLPCARSAAFLRQF